MKVISNPLNAIGENMHQVRLLTENCGIERVKHNRRELKAPYLQVDDNTGDDFSPLLLQFEHRLRRLDEELAAAVLHVVREALLVYDHLRPVSVGVPAEVWPRVGADHFVPASIMYV